MAPDDHSGARPAGPVVLRIKLRYDDLDAMVQRFAINVGKSGMFLPTRSMQPIGTELKFELRLANDTPVMVGLGRVKYVKEPDPEHPRAPFGLGVELMRVSREGREVIIRMIERRRELGLADVAIPMPEQVEATPRTTLPLGTPVPELHAPRHRISDVTQLPPEPSRSRRPAVAELIEKAAELSSRMQAPVPEIDEQVDVDVERAMARARALAGGDLDTELAQLREDAAAPTAEITIEAASAELARALGGKPITKRERAAAWAPPPAVEIAAAVGARVVETVEPAPRVEPAPVAPAAVDAAPVEPASVEAAPAPDAGDSTAVEEALAMPTAEPTPTPAFAPEPAFEVTPPPSIIPVESYVIRKSERIDAPYHEAYDSEGYHPTGDYGTPEETPIPTGDEPARPPTPLPTPDQNMMIDDDADLAAFERALDAARIRTGVNHQPAPPRDDEEDEDDELAVDTGVRDPMPEQSYASEADEVVHRFDEQIAAADPYAGAAAYREEEDEEIEELDDDDVVEIDDDEEVADDAVVGSASAAPPDDDFASAAPPDDDFASAAPPDDDFASRLDLGDDDEPMRDRFDEPSKDFDERPASFGAPAYERPPSPMPETPSGSYTFAERYPRAGLTFRPHETGEEFDEPHRYSQEPRMLHRAPAEDLEQALSQLDGDIDPTLERPPRRSNPRPLPGLPVQKPPTQQNPIVKKRAPTDDGILIDFDDDD